MRVYVIEARVKTPRSDYNSHHWKPVDADVLRGYAQRRRKQWAEDHPRQEFRVRPYVPDVRATHTTGSVKDEEVS